MPKKSRHKRKDAKMRDFSLFYEKNSRKSPDVGEKLISIVWGLVKIGSSAHGSPCFACMSVLCVESPGFIN